jgi:D-arabinose 1-dehydrogenase-like Zn-dependent alcohol dehydrogenase
MKAEQVPKPGAEFQIVEREIPTPGAGQVRIKVQACGVCHSDLFTNRDMKWCAPSMRWVPVCRRGRRDSVSVSAGTPAGTARVASAGAAIFPIAGIFRFQASAMMADTREYMLAPVEALVPIPESLSNAEAAPLLCAGITTFNALRHTGAFPGDLVAVQGIGDLGHLGLQFAGKFGYNVAVIGLGPETAPLAKKLGASLYIDSGVTNPAEALQSLGGATVILATARARKRCPA